ncbi:MAG: GNAT family N-acetyltransferase [Elusimicrobia bacterium]|nr:GNAT family N-acetyltransferase [Elusimicrobiota bacterium]
MPTLRAREGDAFRAELELGDGRRVAVGPARPDDVLKIRWLYHRIYGGSYPFSLVYNPAECAKAIESDRYLWLLARDGDQAVGSLIFTFNPAIALGKVFGGVVAEEYQGRDLAARMLAFGVQAVIGTLGAARTVYATTRTVNLGPQRLTEKAGFKKLGIFPNAHRVQRSETHTLGVYFGEGALEGRTRTPRLPLLLKPFFQLVRRETGLPEAEYADLALPAGSSAGTSFEVIQAGQFILRRFQEVKRSGKLALDFFPFHEPNLLLMSPDGRTELFLYRSSKDGHCVLTGAYSETLELHRLLDDGAAFLEDMGVRYLEALVDASDAESVNHALGARFLPSAYYPAMRWDADGKTGRDYVVLSRSLAVLDFRGITLQPAYADYLREYFRLWRELHVGQT